MTSKKPISLLNSSAILEILKSKVDNNMGLPANKPKKMRSVQPDINQFVKELQMMGVESSIHIEYTLPNRVNFSVSCRNSKRDKDLVGKLLFAMFGV